MHVEFIGSLSELGPEQWQQFEPADFPFISREYLVALETTGCVGGNSGWHPHHMLLRDQGKLLAFMPCYEKDHSYGEYVFDWSWAQAWAQTGRDYYPKLVCAIPFTPVPGPRLLHSSQLSLADALQAFGAAIENHCEEKGYSGWHLLFPDEATFTAARAGRLQRQDVQFHWQNRGYNSFDEFLGGLRSNKRKQIRRERRRVGEQGVTLVRLTGTQIDDDAMQAFYACYCETYLRRSGHRGYLTGAFFEQIRQQMSGQIMLVLALRDSHAIAASLFFYDSQNLYGRYWGALEDVDSLHFEACYYQGIEFCIERQLASFNPGTQGEHKLVRGFEPVTTRSLHWVSDAAFRPALEDFLRREADYKGEYASAARDCLPFRADSGPL